MSQRFHRFNVGDREVSVLSDGLTAFPGPFFMVGVDEQEQLDACRRHQLDPEAVASNLNCVHINMNGNSILFDTGAGSTMPGCGMLPESLSDAGISPESIDLVIHTHLYPDHTEWNFWSSESTLASLERAELWKLPDFEPAMADAVRDNILVTRDRVDVFKDDRQPVPGVQAVPAFGHTPGHLAFVVDLGGESLFITGDLVLSPFHIDHAGWFRAVDLRPEEAIASRARIFNHAAESGALVSGYHLQFPGIGRLTVANDGWNWVDEFEQ